MFYNVLLSLCKERGITVSALARDLNIAKGSPSNWQRGASPNSDAVIKIAKYFGVSCDYLLELDDVPSRAEQFSLTREEHELVMSLRGVAPQVRHAVYASVHALIATLDQSSF